LRIEANAKHIIWKRYSEFVKTAVIFDMDGVLIDSETRWAKMEYSRYSELLPGWNRERQRQLAGRSIEGIYEVIKGYYPDFSYGIEEFHGIYEEFGKKVLAEEAQMNPGAEELILELRKEGFKTALATSTSRPLLDLVIDRFDLNSLFEVIVTASEVDGRGKPFPDIYLHTLELLGVDPTDAIAIEDTPNGIQAAKSAGLYCIGYVSDPDYDRSQADIVITDFSELNPDCIRVIGD